MQKISNMSIFAFSGQSFWLPKVMALILYSFPASLGISQWGTFQKLASFSFLVFYEGAEMLRKRVNPHTCPFLAFSEQSILIPRVKALIPYGFLASLGIFLGYTFQKLASF